MSDRALYLLAEFDSETQNILSNYYQMLHIQGFTGQQTKDIPYHFTLGNASVEDEDTLTEKLHEICQQTASFDILLSHMGLFGQRVLFIAPNSNFELLEIQHRFFPDCGHGCHPFAPHATLLIDEPTNIFRAVPLVTEHFQIIPAKIISVSLYEFFPARLIDRCRLVGK